MTMTNQQIAEMLTPLTSLPIPEDGRTEEERTLTGKKYPTPPECQKHMDAVKDILIKTEELSIPEAVCVLKALHKTKFVTLFTTLLYTGQIPQYMKVINRCGPLILDMSLEELCQLTAGI